MRLLNVNSFTLGPAYTDNDDDPHWPSEPVTSATPKYAILSHRWIQPSGLLQQEEAVFRDLNSLSETDRAWLRVYRPLDPLRGPTHLRNKLCSFAKIAGACNQVRLGTNAAEPIDHIWIDNICIDKEDNIETAVAINSMFRWYERAEICYVYLSDVSGHPANDPVSAREFQNSQWFSRGWTLQELLAPRKVEFFNKDWQPIGSKNDFVDMISAASRIKNTYILGPFNTASIAQKMSWLATRTTKLQEDLAYCMLGILNVHLEPRYGQGKEEFTRLQAELVRTWNQNEPIDESLFAWKSAGLAKSGLFAPGPLCFRDSGDIIFDKDMAKRREATYVFALPRSKGMSVNDANQVTIPVPISFYPATYIQTLSLFTTLYFTAAPVIIYHRICDNRKVKLNCWVAGKEKEGKLCALKIELQKDQDGTWTRVNCGELFKSSRPSLLPSKLYASHRIMDLLVVGETRQ